MHSLSLIIISALHSPAAQEIRGFLIVYFLLVYLTIKAGGALSTAHLVLWAPPALLHACTLSLLRVIMEPPNGASNLHTLVKTEPYSDYPNVVGGPSSSAQFSFVYAEQFANYPLQPAVIGGAPTLNTGAVPATNSVSIIGGQQQQLLQQPSSAANVVGQQHHHVAPPTAPATPVKQRHIYESPEARTRRLARNAERMRERRLNESDDDYRERLRKMAASNRERRNRENEVERAMRHIRDAARQRLRRAMETPDQRAMRLAKLAERSRQSRLNETPEQRSLRQRKCLESNRLRYQRKMEQQQQQTAEGAAVAVAAAPAVKTPAAVVVPTVDVQQTKMEFCAQPDNQQQQVNAQNYNLSVYQTYQSAKQPTFPELPAHLAPANNDTKYFVQMPTNYLVPGQSPQQVQYIYTMPATGTTGQLAQTHPQQVHSMQTTTTTAAVPSTTAAQPSYVLQQSPMTDSSVRDPTPLSYAATPAVTKGRPLKIFPANDYRSIAPTLHVEAQRQHQLNQMLDTQITHIINNPRSARGRPAKGPETDEQRAQRLRRMADQRAAQRDRETPEERAERLRDLAERARKRREQTLSAETADERRDRLQKQAEYARQRQAGLSAHRRGK